jgi:hypothetical protein
MINHVLFLGKRRKKKQEIELIKTRKWNFCLMKKKRKEKKRP